jgi:hypothetical protein
MAMLTTGKIFAMQVSTNAYLTDFFYPFTCIGGLLGMLALTLLDAGMVQERHIIDTMAQKLVSIFIGGVAFLSAQVRNVTGRAK